MTLAKATDDERMQEFLRLFTSHELRLRAFAMSMIANYADAEDVLQQANLVMWKRFETFEPGTKFMSWAGRIVYLVALQQRRQKRRDRLKFGDEFFAVMVGVAVRDDVSARLGEHEHALSECVQKLKPEQQEMLRAKYAENVSIDEMGLMFNRSVEAIYKALNRMRRMLHDCVRAKVSQGSF